MIVAPAFLADRLSPIRGFEKTLGLEGGLAFLQLTIHKGMQPFDVGYSRDGGINQMTIIVWRGAGLIVFAFLIVPLGLALWKSQLWTSGSDEEWQDVLLLTMGFALSGAACVVLGRKLNRDARTIAGSHHLYFIRVEYWGFLILALAVAIAVFWIGTLLGLIELPK